jgi:probable HAF family extracellular repeat protein
MAPLSLRPVPSLLLATLVAFVALGDAHSARAQNQPSFQGLGGLHLTVQSSGATAVNADGSVVVGQSLSASGDEAFLWTESGGMQGLGDLSGGPFASSAAGVSDDGLVVVGTGATGSESSRAFRTVSPFSSLSSLPNFSCSLVCPDVAIGNGVSPDGNTVVGAGTDRPLFGDPFVEAARWVGGSFSIDGLGHLSGGGVASSANDVSSTGLVVGDSDSSSGSQAFVWNGSMSSLPAVVGSRPGSSAMAIASDGSAIVGYANTETDGGQPATAEAVIWTDESGAIAGFDTVTLLGTLPGASVPGSRALAVAGDGSIVVGVANDSASMDVAFIWDAAGGMRDLKQELEAEYGLDLEGWILDQATGISDVNGAGEVVIVGLGTNPDGDPEAWRAVLSPTHCNDGVDNDGDGQTDYPADPECTAPGDRSEVADCADGLDNDGDGQTDHPADAECLTADDASETPDCGDGFDNDGDGQADFPDDPGCRSGATLSESPACDNGVDDDGDTFIDFPGDPGCVAGDDFSEMDDCSDGLDNDGDGLIDHPSDPECAGPRDPAEDPECDDRVDNDGDGRRDWPEAAPACVSASDPVEKPQCQDGTDNDGDGQADYPDDPDCVSPLLLREDPPVVSVGDLLAVSRAGRRLFSIDPATGAQTALVEGAQWTGPEGVALRGGGEVVVIDPSGLYEVDTASGTQRRFSGPFSAFESLQVVFDGSGDPVVLELGSLMSVPWSLAGVGTASVLVPLPTPNPVAHILSWVGDSLAREPSGDYLVTGLGAGGDGVFRIDGTTLAADGLAGAFTNAKWFDLDVEADGTIVAVGSDYPVSTGLFRIDPVDGTRTPVSVGAAWTDPVAVAVAANGDLFVADAGTCDSEGVCTGSSVVRVDPASGARLDVWTGGFIDGRLDLAVVSALPVCADGVDNDGDGLIDFPVDSGCTAPADPSELAQCADGLDNDGDGAVDLADSGCKSEAAVSREDPPTTCNDDLDNEGDGRVDWDGGPGGLEPDPQCVDKPWAVEVKRCGLGAELAGVLASLLWLERRRRARA